MHVAFINENTLGHTSHVPRFVREIQEHPEWGIVPYQIDASPLPPELRHAERGIRGLHRLGLDGLISRWRDAISLHAANQLQKLAQSVTVHAAVVNTQSAGLSLPEVLPNIPCFVALDATFEQLARSPWFGPTRISRWLQPITLARLRRRERRLLQHARLLLPWSGSVQESLVQEYRLEERRIRVLPPSMRDPGEPAPRSSGRLRLLFIGGDFQRKGGPELLEAWRNQLRDIADLDVVTRSPVPTEPGLRVHRAVEAGSSAWRELWGSADLFVFPSHLETFGIVLLEALAFGVPVLSARTGAAEHIIQHGSNGLLLDNTHPATIATAIRGIAGNASLRASLASAGRSTFLQQFDLTRNASRLAEWLKSNATQP